MAEPPPADEYLQSFRASMMDVIYAWSKGASFAEICGMTDMFEGSIVRSVGGGAGGGLLWFLHNACTNTTASRHSEPEHKRELQGYHLLIYLFSNPTQGNPET